MVFLSSQQYDCCSLYLVGRGWEKSSKLHKDLLNVYSSVDWFVCLLCPVLFWIYFTWAGLSCNGEVKRWFLAPQENSTSFPHPSPLQSVSFPIPHANGELPQPLQSLLHQSFTKGFGKHPFRYLYYNPVKKSPKISFLPFYKWDNWKQRSNMTHIVSGRVLIGTQVF